MSSEIYIRIEDGEAVISERYEYVDGEMALKEFEAAFERFAELACGSRIYGSLSLLGGSGNDKGETHD